MNPRAESREIEIECVGMERGQLGRNWKCLVGIFSFNLICAAFLWA